MPQSPAASAPLAERVPVATVAPEPTTARSAPEMVALPTVVRRASTPRKTSQAGELRPDTDPLDGTESAGEGAASTLGAEVARLDSAREAFRAGAFDEAIRRVESYHREFPQGVLAPDAEVVAIEALAEQKERDEAAARAAAFLANYPADPHAAKVRRWAELVDR